MTSKLSSKTRFLTLSTSQEQQQKETLPCAEVQLKKIGFKKINQSQMSLSTTGSIKESTVSGKKEETLKSRKKKKDIEVQDQNQPSSNPLHKPVQLASKKQQSEADQQLRKEKLQNDEETKDLKQNCSLFDSQKQKKAAYNELCLHAQRFAHSSDVKAWLGLIVTLIYQIVAILFIRLSLGIIGWPIHCLNIVRIFIQFHDMGHYSFFSSVRLNRIVGHIVGIWVHFPYELWRHQHNEHHEDFCNTDKAEMMEFTKKQWESWSTSKKLFVRLFRQPVVYFLFTIQALWMFLLTFITIKKQGLISLSFLERILSFILLFVVFKQLGILTWELYLALHIAQAMGFILFHLQHSVNTPYRVNTHEWEFMKACLQGSTFLEMPLILQPFTIGIQYHHIHHINTNVPSYAIRQCHQAFEKDNRMQLKWKTLNVNNVKFKLAVKSLLNVMLDEDSKTLIPFSYKSLW